VTAIEYCPLHASAAELLEMVKKFHFSGSDENYRHRCQLCDLIAQAEGK